MIATITTAITAVYHHFHCLLLGDEGDIDAAGGVETRGATGADGPCIAPAAEVGEFCESTASVGPPDPETEPPGCHEEEPGVESWGVEYTGTITPGLLEEGNTDGDENAKEGEEEGVKLTPP